MHYRFCVLSLACLFTVWQARGQFPADAPSPAAVHHSISLDVKTVASGGAGSSANNMHSTTGFGAGGPVAATTIESKSTLTHRTVLSIAVRNFSPTPDQIQVEYYFFAQPVGGAKEYILNSDSSKITLQAGETQNVTAVSKEVATTKVQRMTGADGYEPILSQRDQGDKLKGWLVRAVADGKVIQVRASELKWEEYGKDDAKLKSLQAPPTQNRGPRR